MNIHEFQAKALLKDYGISTTEGDVVSNLEEAKKVLMKFPKKSVIKAQVYCGGRGKGCFDESKLPGVFIAQDNSEALSYIEKNLGHRLITKQTGKKGCLAGSFYVCHAVDVVRECYLGLCIDRDFEMPVFIASSEGGVDIETTACVFPEKVLKLYVEPEYGPQMFQLRCLGRKLGFTGNTLAQFIDLAKQMYLLFREKDCSQIEINPLGLDLSGKLVALDAKISFDDSALYRHPDIENLKDENADDLLKLHANRFGMNYVPLDGNIACIVNGAGLAMATMDVIKHFNGRPANFLDLGGKADKARVKEAINIVKNCPNVRSILVNIFGGIAQCDIVAEGIVEELQNENIPVVVRLKGANAEKGELLLKQYLPDVILEEELDRAVELVAKL